jgi:hypothetical protein
MNTVTGLLRTKCRSETVVLINASTHSRAVSSRNDSIGAAKINVRLAL